MAAAITNVYVGGTFTNGVISDYCLAFRINDYSEASDVQSVTLDGQKLQIDELYIHLNVRRTIPRGSAADSAGTPPSLQNNGAFALGKYWFSLLSSVPYGTPVWYVRKYADNTTGVRKYYWKDLERNQAGPLEFDITAQSDIGILDGIYSVGKLYTGETLETVLRDEIGNTIPWSFDPNYPEIAQTAVFGWLPAVKDGKRQSVREHLHALILAYGFIMRRDSNQDLLFTCLTENEKSLPGSVIFNTMSPPLGENVSRVEVAEHRFFPTDYDETVLLFDNTEDYNAANHTLVLFEKAPVYDLTVMRRRTDEEKKAAEQKAAAGGVSLTDIQKNLTEDDSGSLIIVEQGANYAVLTGTGILTGRTYAHITRIVSSELDNNGTEKAASVNDICIINSLNSDSVVDRLSLIYQQGRSISMDILRNGETPGDMVTFTDIYGDERSGYITSMENAVTSFERSNCEILTAPRSALNVIRKLFGNAYKYSRVFTGNGVWTVPPELDGTRVRMTLIGGGSGGASGCRGRDGGRGGIDWENGAGVKGTGGNAGEAGKGGFFLSVSQIVNSGEQFILSSGIGGTGGIATNEADAKGNYPSVPGANGGHTTFGNLTTDCAAARQMDSGFQDLISGQIFALPGTEGVKGGDGGGYETEPHYDSDRNDVTVVGEIVTDANNQIIRYSFVDEQMHGKSVAFPEGSTLKDTGGHNAWDGGQAGISKYYRYKNSEKNIFRESCSFGGCGGGAAIGEAGNTGENADDGIHFQTGNAMEDYEYRDPGNGGNGANAHAVFATLLPGCGGSGGHGGGGGGAGGWASRIWDFGEDGVGAYGGSGGSGSNGQNGADGGILLQSCVEIALESFSPA